MQEAMKPLFLDEIRDSMGGRSLAEPPAITISGVSTDTRNLSTGEVFFAIRGEHFDGHDFLAQAFDKGAAATVAEHVPEDLAANYASRVIVVDDTVRALGRLASYYRNELACTVIAVTGSNGKTTTKELIHHVLSKYYRGRRSQKSFNNHIGVPLTLLSGEPGDQFLVAEAGSNRPGEIDYLGSIIRPDVAVITNVSEAHLESFDSIEHVASEKASLANHVRPGGAIIVNGDRELLLRTVSHPQAMVISFGQSDANDLRVTDLKTTPKGVEFIVNNRFEFFLPVLGRHNAVNCLAAIACARRMGLEMAQIASSLQDFRLPDMRLQIEHIGEMVVLNDAYNSNPASMLSALEVLAELPAAGRRVFFCGEMLELGRDSEQYHRQLGRRIGCSSVTVLVAIGSQAPAIAEEAISAGLSRKNVWTFKDVEEAKSQLGGMIRCGDVILIKGSRAVGMEALLDEFRVLSDTSKNQIRGNDE